MNAVNAEVERLRTALERIANDDPFKDSSGSDIGHCRWCGADRGENHEFVWESRVEIRHPHDSCWWVTARKALGLEHDESKLPRAPAYPNVAPLVPAEPRVIPVGSTSPPKLRAVRECQAEWPEISGEVVGYAVDSDVNEQPSSLRETVRGAFNRAAAAWEMAPKESRFLAVGLESGLMNSLGYDAADQLMLNRAYGLKGIQNIMERQVLDVCACVLFDGTRAVLGLSSAWAVPVASVEIMIRERVDMNAAFKRLGLTEKDKVGSEEGAIGVVSGGRIHRVAYTRQAIEMALVGWRNP